MEPRAGMLSVPWCRYRSYRFRHRVLWTHVPHRGSLPLGRRRAAIERHECQYMAKKTSLSLPYRYGTSGMALPVGRSGRRWPGEAARLARSSKGTNAPHGSQPFSLPMATVATLDKGFPLQSPQRRSHSSLAPKTRQSRQPSSEVHSRTAKTSTPMKRCDNIRNSSLGQCRRPAALGTPRVGVPFQVKSFWKPAQPCIPPTLLSLKP